MAVIIAVLNLKGGSGKTTSAISLASFYSLKGNKVLAMDLDPKASLTHSLINSSDTLYKEGLYQAVLEGAQLPVVSVRERLSVSPGGYAICDFERMGAEKVGKGFGQLLERLSKEFDVIFLDLPSYPSELLLCSACMADRILIPAKADRASQMAVRETVSLIGTPKNIDVLLVQHDARERHTVLIEEELRNVFGSAVMDSKVRRNVALSESAVEYKSIFEYKLESSGARDYEAVAGELFERMRTCFGLNDRMQNS